VLLDAQSAALLSNTSTTRRTRTRTTTDLGSARSGILTAMRELSEVKSREAALYSSLSASRKKLLSTVTSHTTKTSRLRQELQKIDASPEAVAAEQLREETAAVAGEIDELRKRLVGLEMKHADMKRKLVALDNVVEARQSSYKEALESSSKRVAAFLKENQAASPETAVETWTLQAEAYEEKKEAAEKEHGALEEGMRLWEAATDVVSGFETRLAERIEIGGDRKVVKEWISHELERTVEELAEMVQRAEEEGWKLLIAAIGAELQAMRDPGEVLNRNFGGESGRSGFLCEQDQQGERRRMNYSPLDD
jgi:predicted  nucleic acid-binding Zn-ribbon protein